MYWFTQLEAGKYEVWCCVYSFFVECSGGGGEVRCIEVHFWTSRIGFRGYFAIIIYKYNNSIIMNYEY